jgi:PAS domain S-box-containing protein
MVEHSPSGAVYVENGTVSFNTAVEKIIGYNKNEIKTIDDWFRNLYKENFEEVLQMYEEDQRIGFPEPRIMYITCKNDEQKWIYFSAYKHKKGEIWLVNDVTESTESEIELIKKNKELVIAKNKAEESDKIKLL